MLEKLRRACAVASESRNSGEVPQIHMVGTFEEFFDAVREETDNGVSLPTWRGEMYFECHRGTYTTHASIKKGNRMNEILARQAEYAACLASLHTRDFPYPFKVSAPRSASLADLLAIRCRVGRSPFVPVSRCPTGKWDRDGKWSSGNG
jgi:alpha-mannosidase